MQIVDYPKECTDNVECLQGLIAYKKKKEFIKLSMCDMLKIGIGSSSSHTLAPWLSAQGCYQSFKEYLKDIETIDVELFGSLAFVGRGHYTTLAIPLGLLNKCPGTFNVNKELEDTLGISDITQIGELKELKYEDGISVKYNLIFNTKRDTKKEKMVFTFNYKDDCQNRQRPDSITYYSYGGGAYGNDPEPQPLYKDLTDLSYKYKNSKDFLDLIKEDLSISEAVFENELLFASYRKNHPEQYNGLPQDKAGIFNYLKKIAVQMGKLIYDGCTYPDDDCCYKVMYATKKAKQIFYNVIGKDLDFSKINNWRSFMLQITEKVHDLNFEKVTKLIGAFALAISEQNAALRNVVTAPTNGACGVVPAVLYYYVIFRATDEEREWLFNDQNDSELNNISRFLLTANAIGGIVKSNANIAGGLGGCQAEIGTAASMAAGAMTEVSEGTPSQVFNAAELALETFLGSTCDPIGGLVEIPCIERNLTAANISIGISQEILELGKKYEPIISFDAVVETMENVSNTMSPLYKETSEGGLAKTMKKDVHKKRPDLFPSDEEGNMRLSVYRTLC